VGALEAGETTTSAPRGANGFGLPSVPSGVNKILESNKAAKVGSRKSVSSSFMFSTPKSTDKKFWVREEPLSDILRVGTTAVVGPVVEINAVCSGGFLIKKTKTKIKIAATTINIMMFFIFGIFYSFFNFSTNKF
jgi:hypothetical protein